MFCKDVEGLMSVPLRESSYVLLIVSAISDYDWNVGIHSLGTIGGVPNNISWLVVFFFHPQNKRSYIVIPTSLEPKAT